MGKASEIKTKRARYKSVFEDGEIMKDGTPTQAAVNVIAELREFCRADKSCIVFANDGHVDTHATAVLEGRREVWLKITQILNITDEQLILIDRRNAEYGLGK